MDISMVVEQRLIPLFCTLTGYGFRIKAETRCSLKKLLCGGLGIEENYLKDRIQTVFLNGKAVDDTETAIVTPGATVALSAAMPGLVGATFRKGGFYAPMRREISHDRAESDEASSGAKLELKLFNLIQKELGPIFLNRGIDTRAADLGEFLHRNKETIFPGLEQTAINGATVPKDRIFQMEFEAGDVFLQVKAVSHFDAGEPVAEHSA
jgi:hypothetical protein